MKALRTWDDITSNLEDGFGRMEIGGWNHFGPRTKSLRTWRTKLSVNSGLEDEIEMLSNSDLEDEIEIQFGPGG